MRVLVTGAAGQLGSAIVARFSRIADVEAFTRQRLDISNAAAVQRIVGELRPDVIVNCAAYNDVDGAEDNASQALQDNALAVLALAEAARGSGAVFVHYSTDFVFDGDAERPYTEEDSPNPRSHYGLSKLLGEWFSADAGAHYVLRVESLFGGIRAKSSIDRILDALRSGQSARVFFDRTVTPSYVVDVADATADLIGRRLPFGVYHCVNTGMSTWLGIAEEAARLLKLEAQFVPVSVKDVQLRAARPQFCALANDKLRDAGIPMPDWRDALRRYVETISAT